MSYASLASRLTEIGQEFYARGWVFGTAGNFSAVVDRDPLRVAITSSGLDKGNLQARDILLIDGEANVLEGQGKPSAETALHLAIYAALPESRGCLHTHSIWGNLLGDLHRELGHIPLSGQEMLKGLAGVKTHEHEEQVPILENTQDYGPLSAELAQVVAGRPDSVHGVILRRHGLYTWGQDLEETRRHIEIFEYLFELAVRGRSLGSS